MIKSVYLVVVVYLLQYMYKYATGQRYLTRVGKDLRLNGEKVFLSGMNQAWVHYAYDFGNGGYSSSKQTLYKTLRIIHKSGGNSMRIWLHVSGQSTPTFDKTGHVSGPGTSLISDLKDFLMEAERLNVLVNVCLWNAALEPTSRLRGLIMDDDKLSSYIVHALIPMVTALRDLRSLGSWEVMNEPAGFIKPGVHSSDPCFDTSDELRWLFSDWTHTGLPLQNLLRFIGRQSDAIHGANPKALVTVGIWSFKFISGSMFRPNYYSDQCLERASGGARSGLDFYQVHTYDVPVLHLFLRHSPFTTNASFYETSKPVLIGEFSAKCGGGMSSPQEFLWAYTHGYSGAWSWSAIGRDTAADSVVVQETGMATLKDRNNQTLGGRVNITLNNADFRVTCDAFVMSVCCLYFGVLSQLLI